MPFLVNGMMLYRVDIPAYCNGDMPVFRRLRGFFDGEMQQRQRRSVSYPFRYRLRYIYCYV